MPRAVDMQDEPGSLEIAGAVEALRNEEELRLAQFSLDHAGEAVFWLGSDAKFLYANRAACRSLGYPREELLKLRVYDIAPDLTPEAWPGRWEQTKARGTVTFESRHRARDGRVFPVEVTVNHLRFGGHEYHCVFARDITGRKRQKKAMLAQTEAALLQQRIAVASNAAASVPEAMRNCLHEMCAHTGWPAGHVFVPDRASGGLVSSKLWHLDSEDDFETFRRRTEELHLAPLEGLAGRVLVGGEPAWAADLSREPAPRRAAARECGLTTGFAFPALVGGKVAAVFELFTDEAEEVDPGLLATAGHIGKQLGQAFERLRAERALRESETKYRTLFNHAADPIFIFDQATRRFLDCNQTAVDRYGYTLAELRRMTPHDLHPSDELEKVERNIGDREDLSSHRYVHVTRDGRRLDVEISTVEIQYKGRDAWLSVVRDITERRRADEERRDLEAQVQHAQKLESLGVLAGGIAHDFNNLLVGILGYSNLALSELPDDSPVRPRLAQVVGSAQRAADLAKQLLAYSGKGKFVVEKADVSKVVEEVSDLLELSISKKAELKYAFHDQPLYVEADRSQLHQVIMNLIINASDALGDDPGTIEVRTGAVAVERGDLAGFVGSDDLAEGEHVFMEIADTGSGMDAETQARIFDPFFTTKFTGRGLGLAAVLGIIRSHRGAIRVESELERGTTVRFVLPRVAAPEAEDFEPPPDSGSIRLPRHLVLVVDDEPTVRAFASTVLTGAGIEVVQASDGAEAVEIFRRRAGSITLVLLDMTMPIMSGEETLRELRRIRPDVKALLSSGYSEQDATSQLAGEDGVRFLQKPYMPQDLLEKVREALPGGKQE